MTTPANARPVRESKLYLVVPVYNEAENLPRLLKGIDESAPGLSAAAAGASIRLVFVDDGSQDETVRLAEEHGAARPLTVLKHGKNFGPGRAFATAFEWLGPLLGEEDLVMTLEGDNTSRLETGRRMLVRLGEGYDVVLASPYSYGGGFAQTSLLRLFLSHAANGMVKVAFGVRGLHTMSSFFRLYRPGILKRLQAVYGPGILERAGFESMVEMIIKLIMVGATISEVEMKLDSSARVGASKMKILTTIRGYLVLAGLRPRWVREAKNHGYEAGIPS
jgi:dolichol-phosphate mannosyltransferase